jgi:hypothetical protein
VKTTTHQPGSVQNPSDLPLLTRLNAAQGRPYLNSKKHWTRLANSCEYNLTLERFLMETYKKGWPFQTEKLPQPPEYGGK